MAWFRSVLMPQRWLQMSERVTPTELATEYVQASKSYSDQIFQPLSAQKAILSAIAAVASTILPLKSSGQRWIHSASRRVTGGRESTQLFQLKGQSLTSQEDLYLVRVQLTFLRINALRSEVSLGWSSISSTALKAKQQEVRTSRGPSSRRDMGMQNVRDVSLSISKGLSSIC